MTQKTKKFSAKDSVKVARAFVAKAIAENRQGLNIQQAIDEICANESWQLTSQQRSHLKSKLHNQARKKFKFVRAKSYEGAFATKLVQFLETLDNEAPAKRLDQLCIDYNASEGLLAPSESEIPAMVLKMRYAAKKAGYIFVPSAVKDRILHIANEVQDLPPMTVYEIADRVCAYDRVERDEKEYRGLVAQIYDVLKDVYKLYPADKVMVQGSLYSQALKALRTAMRTERYGLSTVQLGEIMLGKEGFLACPPDERTRIINCFHSVAASKEYELGEVSSDAARARNILYDASEAGANLTVEDALKQMLLDEEKLVDEVRIRSLKRTLYINAINIGFEFAVIPSRAQIIRNVLVENISRQANNMSSAEVAIEVSKREGINYRGAEVECLLRQVCHVAQECNYDLRSTTRNGRVRIKYPDFLGTRRDEAYLASIAGFIDYVISFRGPKTVGSNLDILKYAPLKKVGADKYVRRILPIDMRRAAHAMGWLDIRDGNWCLTEAFVEAWKKDSMRTFSKEYLAASSAKKRRDFAHLNAYYNSLPVRRAVAKLPVYSPPSRRFGR